MHKLTRREFIFGSVAVATVAPLTGIVSSEKNIDNANKLFEDIRIDRYYELQGGHYGDTGGVGEPGYVFGHSLVEIIKYWKHCREFDDNIDIVEKRGFYLSPTQYFGAPYKKYDRIYLTKKWLVEFYNKHKNDDKKDWKCRYDKYLCDVKSGKYKLDNNY